MVYTPGAAIYVAHAHAHAHHDNPEMLSLFVRILQFILKQIVLFLLFFFADDNNDLPLKRIVCF